MFTLLLRRSSSAHEIHDRDPISIFPRWAVCAVRLDVKAFLRFAVNDVRVSNRWPLLEVADGKSFSCSRRSTSPARSEGNGEAAAPNDANSRLSRVAR